MSNVVEKVKAQVDHACLQEDDSKLVAGKCSLHLTGSPEPRLIIHFDKPGSPLSGGSVVKPDFLFLSDTKGKDEDENTDSGLLVPIEMSGGRSKRARHIKNQLQAGVDWIKESFPEQDQLELMPIYCGPIKNLEKKEMSKPKNRVMFRGQQKRPRLRQCGSKLTDALKASEG